MIHTQVATGASLDLHLEEVAFLVYSGDGRGSAGNTYVEIRPIIRGPNGPEYGAGRAAEAADILRVLQRDAPPKLTFLDTRLLAASEDEAAWWTPPARKTPFFSGDDKMKRHDGKTVSMPALLYHVKNGKLRIRALACRGRPHRQTPLFVAPLWNIYRDGTLCMGSMPVPKGPPAECIDAWERAFWDSAFTTPHDTRVCAHPKGYGQMMKELRDLPRFPSRWLVPSKERMEQWLTRR